MAGINAGRVIGGGLVAGLIINVVESIMNAVVLADDMMDVYAKIGVGEPGGGAIAGFLVLGFVLGFLIAWTYAAVRPRFGPGPRTAIMVAVAVWVAACLVPITGWMLLGAYPTGLGSIGLVYGFVEFLLAALAAGALYQEALPT
jgi:hypothetical protein